MGGMRFAPVWKRTVRPKMNYVVEVAPVSEDVEDKYTESVYGVPGDGDYGREKESRLCLSDEGRRSQGGGW